MYNGQYYNPYMAAAQPGSNFNLAPPLEKQQVIRVNGKNGADAYQLAPNSSVLLLDTSAPLIWLVQTDGAGYKTSTPYSIAPYKPEPVEAPVPSAKVSELQTRINRIEEELKEYHEKSNSTNTVKYTITKPSK